MINKIKNAGLWGCFNERGITSDNYKEIIYNNVGKEMSDSTIQLLTMVFANFGIIWWFRKESREDWKMIHQELKEFKDTIRYEMKDFHERLLEIERKK